MGEGDRPAGDGSGSGGAGGKQERGQEGARVRFVRLDHAYSDLICLKNDIDLSRSQSISHE
jgi:hypothetical protein